MRNAAEFYRMEQLRGMVDNKNPKELLMLTFSEIISNLRKINLAIENANVKVNMPSANVIEVPHVKDDLKKLLIA